MASEHTNAPGDKRPSRRTQWNFWVDIVTGIVFAAMVGTGILEKWVLPPGSRGGAGLVWLGEGRHFYADIHFWLGIAMLALVILHVWLHWDWVLRTWAKLVGRLGSPVTWILIAVMVILIILPLLIPRQYSESYLKEHEKAEQESNQGRGLGGGGGGDGNGGGNGGGGDSH